MSLNDDDKGSRSSNSLDYSDDFFGLIFLGSALGLQDAVFAAVFLVASFAAATLSRNSDEYDTLRLPGTVAMSSLGLSLLGKLVVLDMSPGPLDAQQTILAETAVCLASFAYTSSLKTNDDYHHS